MAIMVTMTGARPPSTRPQPGGDSINERRLHQKQAKASKAHSIASGQHVPARDAAAVRMLSKKSSSTAGDMKARPRPFIMDRGIPYRKEDDEIRAASRRLAPTPSDTKTGFRSKHTVHRTSPKGPFRDENPETTHPGAPIKGSEKRPSKCKTESVCQESVFDRLYRKTTAASIGHRIPTNQREALLQLKQDRQVRKTSSDVATTKENKFVGRNKSAPQSTKWRKSVDDSTVLTPVATKKSPLVGIVKAPTSPERTPKTEPSSPISQVSSELSIVTPLLFYSAKRHHDDDGDKVQSPPVTPEYSSMYSPASAPPEVLSPERREGWQSLLLPLSPLQCRGLWRMTWTEANKGGRSKEKRVRSLYLRSMSNVLYEFGTGSVDESKVAADLMTALFQRDFDQCKFWSVEEAVVVDKGDHEYKVHKVARGCATGQKQPHLATAQGSVRFSHCQREVRVEDYSYTVESQMRGGGAMS